MAVNAPNLSGKQHYTVQVCPRRELFFSEVNNSEENPPTQALQLGFELALKERDAVLRDNARAQEERDAALRELEALRAEMGRSAAGQKQTDSGSLSRGTGKKVKDKPNIVEAEQAYEELRFFSTRLQNNRSTTRSAQAFRPSLRQARVPVMGLDSATEGSLQIAGRACYPLCHQRHGCWRRGCMMNNRLRIVQATFSAVLSLV
ncbi:tight junction protein zo-1-like [Plakobranchus ocellatus]|uniref:Tight junction protein zo-1-like n=1 Tax=Plakobranchus ocellatus TaxID=259542 RepID=A0AAV4CG28_9GAST|nr:tight junction protein zo-1-like [Plakobranchus ocellatus]